jgi:hypothetical protein
MKTKPTLSGVAAKQDVMHAQLQMHAEKLDAQSGTLNEHGKKLDEHTKILNRHTKILGDHGKKLDGHNLRMDKMQHQLDKVTVLAVDDHQRLIRVEKDLSEVKDMQRKTLNSIDKIVIKKVKEYDTEFAATKHALTRHEVRISALESRMR